MHTVYWYIGLARDPLLMHIPTCSYLNVCLHIPNLGRDVLVCTTYAQVLYITG